MLSLIARNVISTSAVQPDGVKVSCFVTSKNWSRTLGFIFLFLIDWAGFVALYPTTSISQYSFADACYALFYIPVTCALVIATIFSLESEGRASIPVAVYIGTTIFAEFVWVILKIAQSASVYPANQVALLIAGVFIVFLVRIVILGGCILSKMGKFKISMAALIFASIGIKVMYIVSFTRLEFLRAFFGLQPLSL